MAGYEDFVDFSYKPTTKDVIATFKVKVPTWSSNKRAWGAVASESSVGTWAETKALHYKHVQKVAGKVYWAKGDHIRVAYPQEHFEPGNMSQILASIAGNVFGMKAVSSLRLEDIHFSKDIVRSFKGPKFGKEGINKIFKNPKRPIMLSVPKPKVGMTTEEHCEIGRQIWSGGLDLLKDDENLTNQLFNPFEKRVVQALKIRDKIEKETGEKKSYLINITGPTVKEMQRRAKFVADHGGEFAMIDIITTGWAAVSSVREFCGDYGLAIHAHRAMHGAMTRVPSHGFSMNCVAKCTRLLGTDTLHIGTANIGKLVGSREEVEHLEKQCTLDKAPEEKKLHILSQDWYGIKPLFPCSSGGLHPAVVDRVMKRMGTDIMLQIGGGLHGHPGGSHAGAIAMRQAVDAYLRGESVYDAAKKSKELAQALDKWGRKVTK